ncbi:sigma-70 family RNA polymerase sigma factor [Streptomyces sp. NPDC050388]|uniref:sigma-70 family RNA polymerase sigma factor n=1 Tax=Streptomyces sp. NPDC050388 TaxID=3155781 RepID=UPI00343073CF
MSTSAAGVIRTRDATVPEPSPEQLDALLRELSKHPPGLRRAALRDHVIRLLLPMAHRVTRRFRRQGEEFDDLLQVASLGLIKAVDGYDPTLGHAFLSYALPTVTGELRRHLRDRTTAVRLPRPLQEASGQIFQAVEELEQRLGGCSPTSEQIAEHTGLERGRVLATLRAVHECRPRSLDEPTGHDQEASLACLVGAEDPALGRVLDTVSLASLVKRLPERDRQVLYLRFYRERTQQQIADAVGVSQMQVSRILRRCFDRLREALLASEPCAGDGEETRVRVTGRADRPVRSSCGPRGAAEPVRPTGSTGPARPAPCPAASAHPAAGPAPGVAVGAGRRLPPGGRRPVQRRSGCAPWPRSRRGSDVDVSFGSRRRRCAGAVPRTRRARSPPAAARTKRQHVSRPRPLRRHHHARPRPRPPRRLHPGLPRMPPGDTGACTRADEGAHREASPAHAPARMGVAGCPHPAAARP